MLNTVLHLYLKGKTPELHSKVLIDIRDDSVLLFFLEVFYDVDNGKVRPEKGTSETSNQSRPTGRCRTS